MSNAAINPRVAAPTATATAMHGHHDPHLAHHFDTPEQQYQSGKLGMWVFLGTEILMFGGLFCAYSVYRHNHPEVFAVRPQVPRQDAGRDQHRRADHQQLDDGLGRPGLRSLGKQKRLIVAAWS